MHPLLPLNTDGMRVHHWVSLRPCPCCCFNSLVTTQSASHRSCQSHVSAIWRQRNKEKDTTWRRPMGPGTLKTFSFHYPADTAEQVGGLERRRGTSMEVSFFWNLANKEHLIRLCPAIHKEHSMWFANTKHYWAFCFANRGRTDETIHCAAETNTVCFTRAKKTISLVIFTNHSRTEAKIYFQ